MITKKYLDNLTYEVIGAAIEVQKEIGRGLLESIYAEWMKVELKNRKIEYKSELKIPVIYKETVVNTSFRCDFLIENCLVLELKSVQEVHGIYDSQVLTYMKLLRVPKGVLINFNCFNIFYKGQKTFINEYFNNLE